ncbi:MAG: IS1 family transposase [Bdellovibrionales bacterium]|nr:IS1 family transposase [Bdellovibrionales bacterium]
MHLSCPYCELSRDYVIDSRTIVRHGVFRRTSDSKSIERFRCLICKKTFSKATSHPFVRQKKRQKNPMIFELLASGVSQRRIARLLRVNRTTIARRLIFLGELCREKLFMDNADEPITELQFDDLETIEHSKCKPVSVTLAVEGKTRRLVGFRVASMPAKGLLSKKAIQKYGYRKDERSQKRKELFKELQPLIKPGTLIKSDSNPYYTADVKAFFPGCIHETCIGKRGSVTGQGELKKVRFDPIFSLNHTCAMLRANIARLIRKTWCTTKKRERLADHIAIYAVYHNQHLKKA